MSIVPLDTLARQRAAAVLYREVFAYADTDHSVNPKLLQGLVDNGGTALGVFTADGRALGFCYGFSAIDASGLYHYSQATVIAASEQGRGLGRALKHAQADAARALGARSMRWTYDPALTRNAHFNLDVLGGVGIRFRHDYYGEPGTDRVVVDWPLDPELAAAAASRRVRALADASSLAASTDVEGRADAAGVVVATGADVRTISAPLDGGAVAPVHRPALGAAIAAAMADGLVARSCGLDSRSGVSDGPTADLPPARAVYVFGGR
ncbi:GNAT family N-acetyltransferase [Agromyces protaetiae]|uniref:GNAT family N-acetyltransferase n=1 Tax=Agromyces protaetiae TaxID=2509455 RepID=A0A4P6FCB8_9MICO|nr:GNAT family N-acetyltransferase [Agromyces protaetiae]QAY73504.1 GNAT family N-acetyltransferase [Agromyces protaetiae]